MPRFHEKTPPSPFAASLTSFRVNGALAKILPPAWHDSVQTGLLPISCQDNHEFLRLYPRRRCDLREILRHHSCGGGSIHLHGRTASTSRPHNPRPPPTKGRRV